jgi:Coenzyme PQQ synthesis protein D (PqqD)
MLESLEAAKYARSEVQGNRLGDEIVFFDDRVGKYFATGPVGADIWDMLESPMDFDQICKGLLENYEIDETTCKTQALAFLEKMKELKLVEVLPELK